MRELAAHRAKQRRLSEEAKTYGDAGSSPAESAVPLPLVQRACRLFERWRFDKFGELRVLHTAALLCHSQSSSHTLPRSHAHIFVITQMHLAASLIDEEQGAR